MKIALHRGHPPICEVGESPVWSPQERALYWVDVRAPAVLRLDHDTGVVRSWPLVEPVGSLALTGRADLILAMRSGLHRLDLHTGHVDPIFAPEPERSENRLNDGKVSPCGHFFVFGSMHDRPERKSTGALYRLDSTGACLRIADGLCVVNGIAWSPDGRTFYHSDSHRGIIHASDWDAETGTIQRCRPFALAGEALGRPDGAAVDADGCYWSAGVSAGVLNVFAPNGLLIRRLPLHMKAPTMPAFGGVDLRRLFVTSLRRAGAVHNEQDGVLQEYQVDVTGTPVAQFRG